MSMKLPKILALLGVLGLTFILYGRVISGTPIWDDVTYWFEDYVIVKDFSYFLIWKKFTWPMSVASQKILFQVFQKNYVAYHLINVFLHLGNTILVYKLAERFSSRFKLFVALAFLAHPVCMISVGWMIQLKTLLCFGFAFSSLLLFERRERHWSWALLSWFLFALSILSKSASIMLPFVLLLMYHRRLDGLKKLLLVPFFLLSLMGGIKILSSELAVKQLSEAKASAKKLQAVRVMPEPPKTAVDSPPEQKVDLSDIGLKAPIAPVAQNDAFTFTSVQYELALKSLYYYFWQTLLPVHNEPVRGHNPWPVGFVEYFHVSFTLLIMLLVWSRKSFIPFAALHILLFPFLGIVFAPYMNVVWVSDQHLYLVLPFALLFWFLILEELKCKLLCLVPVAFITFYSYKTYEASAYYVDAVPFFSKSIEANPLNVAVSYNLAFLYLERGKVKEAYGVLQNVYELSRTVEYIQRDRYFPYVMNLYMQLGVK